MKKTFVSILVLLLTMTSLLALLSGVCAEAGETVKFEVGTVKGKIGDTVEVPIVISGNEKIAGFLFGLTYDTEGIEYVSAELGKDLTIGTVIDNTSDENRKSLHVMWFSADEFEGNGEVLILKFKILSKKQKTYPLTVKFNPTEIRNLSSQISAEFVDGSITIADYKISGNVKSFGSATDKTVLSLFQSGNDKAIATVDVTGLSNGYVFNDIAPGSYVLKAQKSGHINGVFNLTVDSGNLTQDISLLLYGDTNGDGAINSTDVILVLRHTLFPTKYAVNQPVDFNGDKKEDSSDAILLLRHSLFPSKYPLNDPS